MGRDSINATISMRTDFLVGQLGTIPTVSIFGISPICSETSMWNFVFLHIPTYPVRDGVPHHLTVARIRGPREQFQDARAAAGCT